MISILPAMRIVQNVGVKPENPMLCFLSLVVQNVGFHNKESHFSDSFGSTKCRVS